MAGRDDEPNCLFNEHRIVENRLEPIGATWISFWSKNHGPVTFDDPVIPTEINVGLVGVRDHRGWIGLNIADSD